MKYSIYSLFYIVHQGVEEQQAAPPAGPAPLPPTEAARSAAQRDRRTGRGPRGGRVRFGRTGSVTRHPLGSQQHLQD